MAGKKRGAGSLLQLAGCKFWYADYYSGGKRIRVSTREESKSEAQRALNKLLADRDAGVPETDRSLRYGDLRAGLIQNYKEKGNKSLHLRANGDETVNGLAQLDDFFGYSETTNLGPYIRELTTETGRQFVRARKAEGAGNAVINRSLACLRRMLKLAYEERKIAAVPIIRLLKEPPARTGTVSEEKFDELLAALPTHLRPLVCFLYWTGVRGAEAFAIEWDQVDLDEGLIRLREGETKNDEARSIPLASPVLMLLRKIEPKTGRVFDRTNLRKEWQKACVAVGLGTLTEVEDKPYDPIYRGLNIHDLRRSALTELTRHGVHTFVAMKISGHKDPSVFQRYNIVNTEDIQAAMRLRETFNLAKLEPKRLSVNNSVKKR
jgi:integrase